MLVLSRKKHESIRIGEDIEIKVLDVRGGRVRLGIVAPVEVSVVRHELLADEEHSTGLDADDTVVALAGDSGREDTLCSGTARNHKTRTRRPR